MPQYILALDQGTTSSRALLFDAAGEVAALAQQEFRQNYPRPGWVEHDAREIWSAQYAVARRALEHAGVDVKSVAAIAITNQRETTVLWDRFTGEPIAPAIVWQDRRTAERVEALEAQGLGPLVRGKTGLRCPPASGERRNPFWHDGQLAHLEFNARCGARHRYDQCFQNAVVRPPQRSVG